MLTWQATVSVIDAKGQTGKIPFHMDTPDLIDIVDTSDDPVDFVQTFCTMVDALIGGAITGAKLTIEIALPGGIKTSPLAASDVEEGVIYLMRSNVGGAVKMRVPTFDETFINQDGSLTNDTEVADFEILLTHPEDLPADWGVGLSDNRGASVNRLVGAHEQFKSSRGV